MRVHCYSREVVYVFIYMVICCCLGVRPYTYLQSKKQISLPSILVLKGSKVQNLMKFPYYRDHFLNLQ